MRKMLRMFSLASAMLLMLGSMAFGQVQFKIPVTITNGSTWTTTIEFGVSGDGPGGAINDNTYGIDIGAGFGLYEEFELPPAPPTPLWETRFQAIPGRPSLGTGLGGNFYGYTSSTQVDSFLVDLFGSDLSAGSVTISWPNNISTNASACILKGNLLDPGIGTVNMLTTFSVTVSSGALLAAADLLIIKTGAVAPSPGPTFSISPTAPLSFGNVPVGGNSTLGVTVTNLGNTNSLVINSAPATPANYAIVPNPAATYPITIPALGSYSFSVTFSPTASGVSSGDIVWSHNAPGSPTNYAVTGTGVSQGGTLQFASPTRTRFDNTTDYVDHLVLDSYVGSPLKALQFEFVTNGILILRSITKGSDISTPASAWNFNYVISRGPVNADGSSDDTVKVVLYGNGATTLPAGTYSNLFEFTYDVVNISDPDVQTTTIAIDPPTVVGSLVDGTNAGVVGGPDQTITINNRTLLGDVNDDDMIDILDLLEVVDHILEIDFLTPSELTRADVAPWTAGNSVPSPDGVVNVQDLALLQNIILTGLYPNGDPTEAPAFSIPLAEAPAANSPALAKLEPGMDAQLTLHVTEDGIAVRLENAVRVKGIQLEIGGVNAPQTIEISTVLGSSAHFSRPENLMVLMYNQAAISYVEVGERIVGNLPFEISDPSRVVIDHVVIADMDNEALQDVDVVISLTDAPELPVDFALEQNYPNPFNPTTSIRFSVPELSNVRIVIYNMLGQEVRTLLTEQMDRGTRVIEWNGKDNNGLTVPSGAYVYRMTADGFSKSNKMILLK